MGMTPELGIVAALLTVVLVVGWCVVAVRAVIKRLTR